MTEASASVCMGTSHCPDYVSLMKHIVSVNSHLEFVMKSTSFEYNEGHKTIGPTRAKTERNFRF